MRYVVVALLICFAGCGSRSPTAPPARSGFLAEIDALPVGLEVIHTPARVSKRVDAGGGWPYRWTFQTEVRAVERPLTITRFAIVAWDGEAWVLPSDQRRYNCGLLDQKTFSEWYNCPDARIEPGKPAIDAGNWAGSRALAPFKQKWVFIGVAADGKEYKGEGVVEFVVE
jgi:hypothetical protein